MLSFISLMLILYIFILQKKVKKDQLKYIYYRDIPTKDTPAYIGKILKGHTNGNDIISTILDLKLKGFINISVENIKGKEKRILSYTGKDKNLELQEHELFLINQLFKNDNNIVFEDYISSKNFKRDFKAFDKMLERKIERKSINQDSKLKNINKILFFTIFLTLGISVFYALLQPITKLIINNVSRNTNIIIIINIIVSAILFVGISYVYISYINKKDLINNIVSLKIAYIFCFLIICLSIVTFNFDIITNILKSEMIWYKIIISFLSAILTLLYMFNITNDKEEKRFNFYIFIVITVLAIILNCKIALSISIVFFSIYSLKIVPKNFNLKEDDFIYKWLCFKKYLEDYSLLASQEENAIVIWEKYLIYAISLGVNKKIIKKYTKLAYINLFNENYYKKFYIEYIS